MAEDGDELLAQFRSLAFACQTVLRSFARRQQLLFVAPPVGRL